MHDASPQNALCAHLSQVLGLKRHMQWGRKMQRAGRSTGGSMAPVAGTRPDAAGMIRIITPHVPSASQRPVHPLKIVCGTCCGRWA